VNDAASKPHTLAESLAGAAQVVAQVLGGASLAHASSSLHAAGPSGSRLRAAVQDLSYTTLRAYGVPQLLTRALLHRSVPDPVLLALLYTSLVHLRDRPERAYVIVDEAVDAARRLGRVAAKGLVNAVLRSYLRLRDDLERKLAQDPVARYRHPQWWIDEVRQAAPASWESILDASNSPPPMTVRVNVRRASAEQYGEQLAAAGMEARRVGEHAFLLSQPVPVERLPGFHEGTVSVQDEGAQRAARLLDAQPGQRVLDACAAPGGKAAHILELADVALTALDNDAARASRIDENFRRLRLRGRVLVGDAAAPEAWFDGRRFDRILADVPCTASGVVRRHPDIKWLRRKSDIAGFGAAQTAILEALWRVLVPGGRLLYVTCSIFRDENEGRVAAFLERNADATRIPTPDIPGGQLLPTPTHDGFFYALLEKG
jgi:16S rRNA (cytosine967-C5)-methyltransferase